MINNVNDIQAVVDGFGSVSLESSMSATANALTGIDTVTNPEILSLMSEIYKILEQLNALVSM